MSQQALTTKVLQAPSSSYPITPSFIKVSNVLEGSLEDITQRLNIQRMRYERIQTSLRQLKTNLLNADQFAGGRYPLEEYRNDLTEALRENESMMEECKQAIASLELKQVVAGLLEVKLEQLGIRPSSSDRDVAPYGGQPRYVTADEMSRRAAEIESYKFIERCQERQDYCHRLSDKADELERQRAWKHKFSRWFKSLV